LKISIGNIFPGSKNKKKHGEVQGPTASIKYFKTMGFYVFKMNWSGSQGKYCWDRIENLGDRLLLIGENSSLSLSAASDVRQCYDDYGHSLENCI
jgi:hypothetical protein